LVGVRHASLNPGHQQGASDRQGHGRAAKRANAPRYCDAGLIGAWLTFSKSPRRGCV
jgi:hypothetical protein